ncbi:hypothetical protein ACFQ0B_41070 [Nonomuraea thailandensis]
MTVHQEAGRPALDTRLISAVAGAPPPDTGAGPLGATLTFAWRVLLKIRHVPEQLLDATLFPIMFTLMFTYVFGGAMIGSPEAYLRYALPGILAQTIVFMTMYTAVTLNTDIGQEPSTASARSRSGARRRSSARCWATRCATGSPPRSCSASRR